MKRWQCTVCGYVHSGEQAPETCPVCGADRSLFVELIEENEATQAASVKPEVSSSDAQAHRCAVCGYRHEGSKPPESCPVCGAEQEQFAVVTVEEAASAGEGATGKTTPADADTQWVCTVCRYIHTGIEPPETCPVCGADKSKFKRVETTQDEASEEPPATQAVVTQGSETPPDSDPVSTATAGRWAFLAKYEPLYDKVTDLMARQHAHPISVHIPNGVLPVAVIFLLLGVLFDCQALNQAAFYNLVFVLLAMPLVLFSGYNDWQKRFGGNMSPVFRIKMICGGIVTGLALVLVLWRLVDPEVAAQWSSVRWLYVGVHFMMLAAAATAGFYGGKLIKFPGD